MKATSYKAPPPTNPPSTPHAVPLEYNMYF